MTVNFDMPKAPQEFAKLFKGSAASADYQEITEADLPPHSQHGKGLNFAAYVPSQYSDPHQIAEFYHYDAAEIATSVGVALPEEIEFNGRFHYAPNMEGKQDQRQGYIADFRADDDGVVLPNITFHSFRDAGKAVHWKPRELLWAEFKRYKAGNPTPAKYNPEEYKARAAKLEAESKAAAAAREALDNAGRAFVAESARMAWGAATEATQHDYLTRKGIAAHGARVATQRIQGTVYDKDTNTTTNGIVCDAGDLIIPLFNAAGELVNVQRIKPDGRKRPIKGGQTKGCYYRIDGALPALVAEGFATAATVHHATGRAVYVAFSAGNMPTVTEAIKEIGAVAADADHAGLKAAEATGLPYLAPPDMADGSDWNDYAAQHGIEVTAQALSTLQPVERSEAPALLNGWDLADDAQAATFLVDGLLEEDAHGILGGASMTYKSFFALRLAHSVCSGEPFMGRRVYRPGPVVYVCGEGQGAVKRRLRALKLHLGGTPKHPIHLIGEGVNLNDPASMATLEVKLAQAKPVLVIFDTFASLAGGIDENSNSEVGAALNLVRDTCRAAGASSMIVHHFGKDAEKGFRGASAFVNNVDFAFTAKTTGAKVAEVGCHKMKDGEHFQPITVAAEVVPLGIYDQNGQEATSLVVIPASPAIVQANGEDLPQATNADRAYSALVRVWKKQCDKLRRAGKPTGSACVTYAVWKEEAEGADIKNFSREVGNLTKRGRIQEVSLGSDGRGFRPIIDAEDMPDW